MSSDKNKAHQFNKDKDMKNKDMNNKNREPSRENNSEQGKPNLGQDKDRQLHRRDESKRGR